MSVLLFFALVSFFQVGNSCLTETAAAGNHLMIPCAKDDTFSCLHNLDQNNTVVTFQDGGNFTLKSTLNNSVSIDTLCISGGSSTITCTKQVTALSFSHVSNLYLENLRIRNCGFVSDNVSLPSIHITNGANVTIRNVTIEDSKGTGLALSNTGGQVTIENCTFQNNGYEYMKIRSRESVEQKYFISGRGGGLQILVGEELNNSCTVVKNCTFKNNFAIGGGGLFVVVQQNATGNKVIIEGTNFTKNTCKRGGGGLQMGYITNDKVEERLLDNAIIVRRCKFDQNQAKYGGGTDILSTLGSGEFALRSKLEFEDCTWTGNYAEVGKAVDIALAPWETLTRFGLFPSPVFSDCKFLNHVADISSRILTVTGFGLTFQGNLLFEGNVGSPIDATSSVLNFNANSHVRFINNTALNGGAIAMRGTTVMFTHENSSFRFERNQAINRGGALYVNLYSKHSVFNIQTCFIQYRGQGEPRDSNVSFVFEENYAGSICACNESRHRNEGDSIYLTTILPCLRRCTSSIHEKFVPVPEALNCIGNVTMEQVPLRRHISTEPHHFATKAENDTRCQYVLDIHNYTIRRNGDYKKTEQLQLDPLHFIPGKIQEIPLKLIDDLCAEVLFHVSVQVVDSQDSIHVDSTGSFITDNYITLYGHPGDTGKIQLSTLGANEVLQRLYVVLDDCPPGYIYVHKDKKCICSLYTDTRLKGIQKCDETLFQAYVKHGYWLGDFPSDKNKTTIASAICPKGFCSYWFGTKNEERECTRFSGCPENYLLPSRSVDVNVCNPNRMGKLAGLARITTLPTTTQCHFRANPMNCVTWGGCFTSYRS